MIFPHIYAILNSVKVEVEVRVELCNMPYSALQKLGFWLSFAKMEATFSMGFITTSVSDHILSRQIENV